MPKTMTGRAAIAAIAAIATGLSMSAHAIADTQRIDIPAGSLLTALETLAKQANVDLVYQDAQVRGLRTGGVTGELSPHHAVMKLLQGTPLKVRRDEASGALLITIPAASAPAASSHSSTLSPQIGERRGEERKSFWSRLRFAQSNDPSPGTGEGGTARRGMRPQEDEGEKEAQVIELEEVVTTGTHIRGVQPTSPLVTVTQQEMRLAGHNNLGEVIRALPQNFAGGQNPGVLSPVLGHRNSNLTGSSGINLRGLGPDASLTLLNGIRLPYDGNFQATDVATIPVAAIERMEVLLDGASAIYGSDAVGGVANIVLKRDFDGAELSARYGVATDGGYEQTQYTSIAGGTWSSGGFLVTGDYSHNTAVRAGQRDYLHHLLPDITVQPAANQKSALVSGHQELTSFARLSLDAFYSDRRANALFRSATTSYSIREPDSATWGAAPALRFMLPGEWTSRLHAAVGRNEAEVRQRTFNISSSALASDSRTGYLNDAESAGIEADGPLFALPGGDARLSVGGGYRRNTYEEVTLTTAATTTKGADRSYHGYAEVHLPLVAREQRIPLVTQLAINGAVRYEDYESFGSVTTPKLGAIWGVAPGLDLKASWGKSFKVPTLSQQFSGKFLSLFRASALGGTSAPADSTVIVRSGGNSDLDPERAEVVTVGFAAQPAFLPGFNLELSWFDIDYTDRIVSPLNPFSQSLSNPLFAEFLILNPTIEQQNAAFAAAGFAAGTFTHNIAGAPYDPARVVAIADTRNINATAWRATGFDLTASYAMDLMGGRLAWSGNANWLDNTQQLTRLAPMLQASGVAYFPAKFKGRIGAVWSGERLALASHVNYLGGIKDTNITPNVQRSSMTTLDLVIDYHWVAGFMGDFSCNIAITNVFDERPPFLQPIAAFVANYDSTNYSALGRVVSATLTKRF